jgi:hypothetical protein
LFLDSLARQVNPLMQRPWFRGLRYYRVIDQAEFSTDLIFTSREALAGLYPRMLDHTALNLKVPHSRRWHVSREGHRLLGAVVQLYHYGIPARVSQAA